MNTYVKMVGFGFFIWLMPFLVSFIIFPLKTSNRSLFESIMPVVLVFAVVVFSILYFKNMERVSFLDGVSVGMLWFAISLIIDLILFLPENPMHMSLTEYMMDIGLTYLIILMIPIGFSIFSQKK